MHLLPTAPDYTQFLLTRPSRDVTQYDIDELANTVISTHTPLAGRDNAIGSPSASAWRISTHTPLAGRDHSHSIDIIRCRDFYSHAPRGT